MMNMLQINYNVENELKTTKKIKLMLYKYFYTNQQYVNQLLDMINNDFNLFTIEYDEENYSIKLKIKKTDMKKISTYSCTPQYYYNVFNTIFKNFFALNLSTINELIVDKRNEFDFDGTELEYFVNDNKLYLLYTVTIVLDNIITIFL